MTEQLPSKPQCVWRVGCDPTRASQCREAGHCLAEQQRLTESVRRHDSLPSEERDILHVLRHCREGDWTPILDRAAAEIEHWRTGIQNLLESSPNTNVTVETADGWWKMRLKTLLGNKPPACIKCGRTEDHHTPQWFCDGFVPPEKAAAAPETSVDRRRVSKQKFIDWAMQHSWVWSGSREDLEERMEHHATVVGIAWRAWQANEQS